MEAPTDRPLLRIGELSRRVGVNDHLLRARESVTAYCSRCAPRRLPAVLRGGRVADPHGAGLPGRWAAQIADAAGARLMAGDPLTEAERTGWPR